MNTLESIPRGAIIPSATNPRRHFDEDSLEELAKSVREFGILQPIVVRPVNGRFGIEPGRMGGEEGWFIIDRNRPELDPDRFHPTEAEAESARPRFELVAGERRWRAAEKAGLEEVPAIVRDMTDAEALEVQITENLQRTDISAMEEAEGFRRLIDLGAYTADTLAEKLGKSRSHVFSRLRLLRLCDQVRKGLEAGEIEASTAELLSKFGTAQLQAEAYAELMDSVPEWAREDSLPIPFRRAKKILEEFYPDVSGAPWGMEDDTLPGADCRSCPKRTGNMPDAPDTKCATVCTDRHCYRRRLEEWRQRAIGKLTKSGKPTLTGDDLDKVFKDGHDDRPGYGSGYVLASEIAYEAKEGGTAYKDLAKEADAPIYRVVAPSGKVVQIVHKQATLTAASQAGLLHSHAAPAHRDRQEVIEDNKRKRAVTAAIGQAVLDKAAAIPTKALLTAYLSREEQCYSAQKYFNARFGDGSDLWKDALEKLPIESVQALLVAAEIAEGGDGFRDYSARQWAERLGVDAEEIERQVLADLNKEEPKAAKKCRPKKGSRR